MTHIFTAHFHIRQYELNARNDLPNSTLARLFQEAAMRASADAGFGVEWYATQRSVWLVRELTVERVRPIQYLDEIAITTWVSDFRRVLSHREYLARDAKTNEVVGRGRAYWVHLNRDTLAPMRIPGDIVSQFEPNGVSAVLHPTPRAFAPPACPPIEFTTPRRVQRYEADGFGHVNNAMYIDWLEEALADAIAARPSTPSLRDFAQDAKRLCVHRHDIEYLQSALPGDAVNIAVRLTGAGKTASTWHLEIRRGEESLVRDKIIALWVNEKGKPARW